MKISVAQLNHIVGDFFGNAEKVISAANSTDADLLVFSELFLTGYPAQDFHLHEWFYEEEQKQILRIAAEIKIPIIIGATYKSEGKLYNAAYYIAGGKVELISTKTNLPNYGVFDEKRYFSSGNFAKVINGIGVVICEDTWSPAKSAELKQLGANQIISISASPYEFGKLQKRKAVVCKRAVENKLPIIYVNSVGGQDELVFDGGCFAVDASGNVISSTEQFIEFVGTLNGNSAELGFAESNYKAAVLGLKDYVHKNGFKKVLLGLSGGIDSALVACIAVGALGAENVRLVGLPTKFTSAESYEDAEKLAKNLGAKFEIHEVWKNYEHETGLVQENIQSRIRGVMLMTLSAKYNELLLTTGNKSEIAVGYTTLYGDSCGAFNPIKDLYKTEVYEVVRWLNSSVSLRGGEADAAIQTGLLRSARNDAPLIPSRILSKPPTAELRHNQTDQDSLPAYEILDAILKMLIEHKKSVKEVVASGYKAEIVEKIAKLLYTAEFKRNQSAPGVKLTATAFGKDWRYPITKRF